MANQQTPCDELFDDDGESICKGESVRVNSDYVGKVHIDGDGKFHIEGWPADAVIKSLEVIPELPINIDDIHPTIKQ